MPPFPRGFETPKFEKYRGKGDPRDHVREFHTACLEVAYEDTYLMRLFPQSLGGTTTSWFSRLPGGIRTFEELIQKFLSHYSYNIERDITMVDLCNTKQKPGELFSVFLQRWRQMSSRRSLQLPERELVEIFISNLNEEMEFHLDVKDTDSFNDMITKGLKCERALIKKGLIKIFNEPKDGPRPRFNTDKPNFWNKNKNIVNDGVVDARTIQNAQPVVRFAGQNPPPQNNTNVPPNQGRITSHDEPRPRQQK